MKLIVSAISLMGWVFFVYYGWQGFPNWFRKGIGDVAKTVPEITRQIPNEDWAKPKEETNQEDKKPGENKPEELKSETSKKLFSGEMNVLGLRSRYNLDIPQDKQSEEAGRRDMGAK